ncbi:hypothetical protein CBR_g36615 [Chara braunii]|uniref:Uncharacterized protein n=1 Tax=Chara braunii TaxID=69332 RepID=A0A388JZA6_CHABU|nr:hypothetical protein CBR_g36615 [Chara braunii]|eukprot:GBG63128.1 hypothetical protein CBR_g36615 [Chara braunii]
MALEIGRRIPEVLRVELDPDIFLPWPPAGPTLIKFVKPNVWEAQRSTAQPAIPIDTIAMADILTAMPQITTITGVLLTVEYEGVAVGEVRGFDTRSEDGGINCDMRLRGVSGDDAFPGKQTGLLWPVIRATMKDVASSIAATLDYGGDSGGSCFYGFGGLFGPGSDFWGRIVRIGDALYAEPEPCAPGTDGTLAIIGANTATVQSDGGTVGGSGMGQPLRTILHFGLNHVLAARLEIEVAAREILKAFDEIMTLYSKEYELREEDLCKGRAGIKRYCFSRFVEYRRRYSEAGVIDLSAHYLSHEISYITDYFFVASMDKAANTPVIMCKDLVRQVAFERLSGPDFEKLEHKLETIIGIISNSNTSDYPLGPKKVPYLMANFKSHKSTLRWITNADQCVFSPVASLCAGALKLISEEVQKYCKEMSRTIRDLHEVDANLWWPIDSINEYVLSLPETIFTYFSTDISRCFETIPTDNSKHGLISKLSFAIKKGFAYRLKTEKDKYIRITTTNDGKTKYGWTNSNVEKPGERTIELKQLIEMNQWLADRNYIQFGGGIWRQKNGIPMGLPCSPIWCNLYFFRYEFESIIRLLRSGNKHLVALFVHTFRYMDDLNSINNTSIREFLMENHLLNEEDPICLYPSEFIEIKEQNIDDKTSTFLNLKLRIETPEGGYNTEKFDKVEEMGLEVNRYIRFDSNRPIKQSLSIILGQVAAALIVSSNPTTAARDVKRIVDRMSRDGFNEKRCWGMEAQYGGNVAGGWWAETVDRNPFLADLQPYSKPTQSLSNVIHPSVMTLIGQKVTEGLFPLITETLIFNDWADLAWSYEHERHRVDLILNGHLAKADERKRNLAKESAGILERTTRLEETLKKIWEVWEDPEVEDARTGGDGYDQALMGIMGEEEEELRRLLDIQPAPPPPPEGVGHGASQNRSNGFVPIGSAQRLEGKVRRQQDRGSVGSGFNDLAPINIKGWKFLADLSKNEVEECRRKALTGTLGYANATPHFGGKLTFPTLSVLDPTKCVFANPVVMQKMIPSSLSLDLRNLCRVWNAGRPYLKCRCGYRNSCTCNSVPIWFDQAVWYLMAKPEIMKPEAGSNRVRIAFLLHHLRNSWRELAKASVTFIWIREMMLTVLRNLERNPELMTTDALAGSTFKTHACPRILANLILPTRITPGLPAPEMSNPKKKKNSMALEIGRRIPEVLRVELDPDIFLPWPPAGPTLIKFVKPNVWEAQRSTAQPAIPIDTIAMADILTAMPQITTITGVLLTVEYEGVAVGEVRGFDTRSEDGGINCDMRLRGVSGDDAFPGKQTGLLWPVIRATMKDVASSIAATLDYGGDSGGSCFYGFGGLFGPGSDFWGRIVRIGDALYAEPEPCAPGTDGTLAIIGANTATVQSDGGTVGGSGMGQPLRTILHFGLNHVLAARLEIEVAAREILKAFDEIMTLYSKEYELREEDLCKGRAGIKRYCFSRFVEYRRRYSEAGVIDLSAHYLSHEISYITDYFFVASMDKAANTPVIMCKDLVRQVAFERLSGPDFEKLEHKLETIIGIISNSNTSDYPLGPKKVPYLMANFKSHKSTLRWITNADQCVFSPVASLCAGALKLISEEVQKYCKEMSRTIRDLHEVDANLWWPIDSINEYVLSLPETIFTYFSTDISRCFETIPTDNSKHGLISKLSFAIKKGFAYRLKTEKDKYIRITTTNDGKTKYGWTNSNVEKPGERTIELKQLIEMNQWLADRNYIQFGGGIWRQKNGIPMGLPCSPIWCNLYFFRYEFESIIRLLRSGNKHLVALFVHTFRYMDDLNSINNTSIREFLMENHLLNEEDPICLYPSEFIEIKEQNIDDKTSTFLNLKLRIETPEGGYNTEKFDKVEEMGLEVNRYIRFDSNRPIKQSLSIILGQVAAALIVSSNPTTAARDVKRIVDRMSRDGFNEKRCWGMVRRVLRNPERYQPFGCATDEVYRILRSSFGMNY